MTKTPPNRRGITFEVGAQLEARDSLKNWYAASIEKIDYEDEKVLIHYRQWSHRYDEWFDWSSPYLRPVERIQLRREGLQENAPVPGFHVNEKVLASWSDCRFYPAKVLAVNKDASYTVKFFDGVVQTVKGIHVKPFFKEQRNGSRSKSQDKNREKHPVTKEQMAKDRKSLENGRGARENGSGRSQRDKSSMSDQDTESDTEEEEEEEEEEEDKVKEGNVEVLRKTKKAPAEEAERKKRTTEEELEGKKMVEKSKKQEREKESAKLNKHLAGEESDPGSVKVEESGRRRSAERSGQTGGSSQTKQEDVNGVEEKEESEPVAGEHNAGAGQLGSSKLWDKEREEGSEPTASRASGEEEVSRDGPTQTRRTRSRPTEGGRAENLREVIELRKRKICLGQTTPPKRSKPDTGTERSTSAESRPTTAPSNQKLPGLDSTPTPSAVSNDKEAKGAVNHTEIPKLADGEGQMSPALEAVLRRQAHLPTTNKYSREPLYRVIKNQPPPILSIELDHNPFKCKAPGCLKSFRKAKLLHYHMKYYHEADKTSENDLSPTRSIQTRASEKQAALESPKRRRTISASMHSSLHSTPRTLHSPRGDGKGARLNEKRRTSAPPAVSAAEQQRPSLREKSKENQLEKSSRKPQEKERERSAADAVSREKEKMKEKKHRDFLRIKLKKKKKKKKKSKSEYTGSEENIDISIFNVQSKLNLLHKFPLSHKHKLSYNSSPGHNTEQIQIDDEDSGSDWSTDSPVWSEDELGTELDVTTPPQEQGVSMATQGFEIVRCICEVQEENDFMIQCEECLCWQHGTCMGLLEDNVPERYTCYICRDPPGQRQSLRYWYDRDWLSSGHMYGLPFLEENYSHQNAKKIAATHQLLGDVHRVIEVLNGLQLKMSILQSQSHPDLKLWCQPWKQAEKPRKRGGADTGAMPSPAPEEGEEREKSGTCRAAEVAAEKQPCRAPSFQDSYISSEHCYQKPRTYYPAVEQRLVVETRGSELEDSLRSTEDLLALEQRYGGPLDPERGKIHLPLQLDRPTHAKEADCCKKLCAEHSYEVKSEDTSAGDAGDADSSLQQQWQINLLDHIEAVQDEVTHRMDFIERELDVLESWLDYTGEARPPEPLARLPQLKHRIKQLLTELGKVQQIALCCST
ncbi:LOW QUALITY PROTEIN: PHD finger protein 20b [Megalops cyprinoides]|uniref:LOW QUALITY PROTEIN: PHD finger protein 20b n=1 Tax=Megalops cyprinoides TaxID=118141 RepID=UPI001863B303|nr:LOW QUALITY PROTEIN: PHD finger protein 20b [Megalops cyprinoides]